MESREKWLDRASQCFGGATMVCLLLLAGILLTSEMVKSSEMKLLLLLPMPGILIIPLVALITDGLLRCGYFDALVRTLAGYGRGALLSTAALALTAALCWVTSLI